MLKDVILENPDSRKLVLEVACNARGQNYTPEMLCQLQKIIEAKYYYWWIMDMKKEEYAKDLFSEDFQYYYNGHLLSNSAKGQARTSKWVNMPMVTMHMGHQPLIWLMDENHARGIFQYEDHQMYKADGYTIETWMVYCDDFEKDAAGVWRISTLRMYRKQADGRYRETAPPEDWKAWEW